MTSLPAVTSLIVKLEDAYRSGRGSNKSLSVGNMTHEETLFLSPSNNSSCKLISINRYIQEEGKKSFKHELWCLIETHSAALLNHELHMNTAQCGALWLDVVGVVVRLLVTLTFHQRRTDCCQSPTLDKRKIETVTAGSLEALDEKQKKSSSRFFFSCIKLPPRLRLQTEYNLNYISQSNRFYSRTQLFLTAF